MLKSFARTLTRYPRGILAWYDHPISTGPRDGTYNHIKTLKRQTYGFRDREYFKLKIIAIRQSRMEVNRNMSCRTCEPLTSIAG